MKNLTIVMAAVMVTAFAAQSAAQPRTNARILKPSELRTMSLSQMKTRGEKYLGEMRGLVTNVLQGLAEARQAGDPQTVKCVSDTLSTIKGLMRLSEQNGIGLSESVIANDRAKAQHEFVKMTIARNKMIELHAQAKGCGGPDVENAFEGAVVLDRIFDEDLPFEDAKAGLDLPMIILALPPSSSPFF
ncbi:MAG: hypothetical protein GXP54_00295 [Deltaproteobacteria bacterium]|nr:hypothetical protein [Deltaproteobacteria bacterium]